MKTCVLCGSHAINPGQNGRLPYIDLHFCDVCYWRERAAKEQREAYKNGYADGYIAGFSNPTKDSNHDY